MGRTIMKAVYGIECVSPKDTVSRISASHGFPTNVVSQYIKIAEETLTNITHAMMPGSFMVDVFPFRMSYIFLLRQM